MVIGMVILERSVARTGAFPAGCPALAFRAMLLAFRDILALLSNSACLHTTGGRHSQPCIVWPPLKFPDK